MEKRRQEDRKTERECLKPLAFSPFLKKNLQATHTWKFVTLPNIFCGCPYDFFWFFSITPFHSTFGTLSTKYFFALIKKFLLQTLGSPYNQNESFTYEVLGIEIG